MFLVLHTSIHCHHNTRSSHISIPACLPNILKSCWIISTWCVYCSVVSTSCVWTNSCYVCSFHNECECVFLVYACDELHNRNILCLNAELWTVYIFVAKSQMTELTLNMSFHNKSMLEGASSWPWTMLTLVLNIQWHASVSKAQPDTMHRNLSITMCWQSGPARPRWVFNQTPIFDHRYLWLIP